MTRLEELFLRWQEQDLSVQELEEFERLLDNPEARALIRDDFLTTNTIREALRTEAPALPAGESSTASKPWTRRSIGPSPAGFWAQWGRPLLVAAGLLIVAAILWTQFSGSSSEIDARQAEVKRRKKEEERIRAEADRKLAELDARRKALEAQQTADEEKRKQALAEILERERWIGEEAKAKIAKVQEPPLPKEVVQEPKPKPEDPPKEPERKSDGVVRTETAVATLERVNAEATLLTPAGKVAAKAGDPLLAGYGLELAAGGDAVLVYADKTKVEVGPETELRDFKSQGGKRFQVARGSVRAVVAKQPLREEMIITTPHGEAKIVGTTLRIVVDPDAKRGMKLEVEEGRVALKNLAGKSVDVPSGHYAVAASGAEMIARPGVVPPPLLVGLAAHLRMDDAGGYVAMDASGRGLDGKLINGPSFVKGKVANSLRLNGTNQYVDLGKRLELPGAYTIALWVKLQANANQTILSDHSATSSLCHYAIEVVPSGQVRYVWLHGDRMNQFTTQDSLTLGTWAHLAATKDESGTVKLHLNGKVIPAVIRDPKHVVQISLPNEFGSLSIGRAGDFDKSYMNGFVDDVRVYTRALQPEEIAILIKLAEH